MTDNVDIFQCIIGNLSSATFETVCRLSKPFSPTSTWSVELIGRGHRLDRSLLEGFLIVPRPWYEEIPAATQQNQNLCYLANLTDRCNPTGPRRLGLTARRWMVQIYEDTVSDVPESLT